MPPRHIAFAVGIAFLWGGNFIASKFGIRHFEPFLFSTLRFLLVALLVVPFVPPPRKQDWKPLLIIATILGTANISFSILGFKYGLDIATTIITIQLGTPFACLLSAVLMGDRLGPWRTLGLAVAFAGILCVVGTPDVAESPKGFLLVLFSALMFGFSTICMKRLPSMPILQLIGWMSLLTVPQTLLLSLALERGQWAQLIAVDAGAAASLLYSAIVSTIIGYGGWYWLMGRHAVTQVAPFALLVPIFGIAMGQMAFHEPLHLRTFIGGAITLAGVAVIVIRRPRLAETGI